MSNRSEWYIIVEVTPSTIHGRIRLLLWVLEVIRLAFSSAAALALVAAFTVKHLHISRYDLSGVVSFPVFIFPFLSFQFSFDVNFAAFAEILAHHFRESAKENYPVPLGLLLLLA